MIESDCAAFQVLCIDTEWIGLPVPSSPDNRNNTVCSLTRLSLREQQAGRAVEHIRVRGPASLCRGGACTVSTMRGQLVSQSNGSAWHLRRTRGGWTATAPEQSGHTTDFVPPRTASTAVGSAPSFTRSSRIGTSDASLVVTHRAATAR